MITWSPYKKWISQCNQPWIYIAIMLNYAQVHNFSRDVLQVFSSLYKYLLPYVQSTNLPLQIWTFCLETSNQYYKRPEHINDKLSKKKGTLPHRRSKGRYLTARPNTFRPNHFHLTRGLRCQPLTVTHRNAWHVVEKFGIFANFYIVKFSEISHLH